MANYLSEWQQAITRTQRFALKVPSHQIVSSATYLDEHFFRNFDQLVTQEIGGLNVSEISLQCFRIHLQLMPLVQKILTCDVLFTIGWIDAGDTSYFQFDEPHIENTLTNGHNSTNVSMHAWLTLGSMEIIDVSFPTTFGVKNNIEKMIGKIIANQADNLSHGLSYKPMLVGSDYLKRTGMISLKPI